MYKKLIALLFTAYCLIITPANAQTCDENCMRSQVENYFAALDQVAKANSTANDIEQLLALMYPSVKYQHIEYGADFTLEQWRKAFNRQRELGRYNNDAHNKINILNTISGKNHIAVEYSHGLIQADGSWQAEMKMFALFGFTSGKISLIREYW